MTFLNTVTQKREFSQIWPIKDGVPRYNYELFQINNLGTMWPRSAVLWLVDKISSIECRQVPNKHKNIYFFVNLDKIREY